MVACTCSCVCGWMMTVLFKKYPFVVATVWNISKISICKASWERAGCNQSRTFGRKNPRTLKVLPLLHYSLNSKIKTSTHMFSVLFMHVGAAKSLMDTFPDTLYISSLVTFTQTTLTQREINQTPLSVAKCPWIDGVQLTDSWDG